jgi:hypothetical protein
MNYNSTGGDDVDCSLNPTGDCSINVTAYGFMWEDRKGFLTNGTNWNPPTTRLCGSPRIFRPLPTVPAGTRDLRKKLSISSCLATCEASKPIGLPEAPIFLIVLIAFYGSF